MYKNVFIEALLIVFQNKMSVNIFFNVECLGTRSRNRTQC